MDAEINVPLPTNKLSFGSLREASDSKTPNRNNIFVALVSTGSFNPPTYMHLRMFELPKDALEAEGYVVIGEYMSLVNDAYKKSKKGRKKEESLKIMLLCGSDLLESFSIPGVWIPDQLRSICREFGIICIRREGKDIEKIIASREVLTANKSNIISVDAIVPN